MEDGEGRKRREKGVSANGGSVRIEYDRRE